MFEVDKDKTTNITEASNYQYNVMSFGLKAQEQHTTKDDEKNLQTRDR